VVTSVVVEGGLRLVAEGGGSAEGAVVVVVVVVEVVVGVGVTEDVRVAVVVSSPSAAVVSSAVVEATARTAVRAAVPCACEPAGRASCVRARVSAGWMSATTVAREAAVVGIGGIRSSGIRGSRSTDPGAPESGGGL
jgi:hypothetical protein